MKFEKVLALSIVALYVEYRRVVSVSAHIFAFQRGLTTTLPKNTPPNTIPGIPSTDPPPAKRTASALKDEVSHAVTAIRTGFMELLAGLPPVQRPADLARVLGIDYSMSRKAMRIIEATDPIGIATEIPRPAGMPRILKACAKLGIDKKALARLEQAVENYESLAKRHGGDRPTFDAMIAGLSPEANERAQFEAKRAAYRANTQILGRQADTVVFFKAIRPSRHREDYLEVIWICAQFGLKRFHPSASLEVMTTTATGPTYPMEIGRASCRERV